MHNELSVNIDEHFELVKNFNKTFKQICNDTPTEVDVDTLKLRYKLIEEEYREIIEAIDTKDSINLIKEFCDLSYVILGYFATIGELPQITSISITPSVNLQSGNEIDWGMWKYHLVKSYDEWSLLKEKNYKESLEHLSMNLLKLCYTNFMSIGVDMDGAFKEVHASNMSKLDKDGNVLYREDGKVLKSDLYFKADVSKFFTDRK